MDLLKKEGKISESRTLSPSLTSPVQEFWRVWPALWIGLKWRQGRKCTEEMSEASALLKHLVCIWAGAKFRGPLVHPTGSITAVQINARGNGITGSGLQSANAQKELHGCSRRSGDSNKVPEQLPDAFLRKIIIAPSLQPHMCSRVATGDT